MNRFFPETTAETAARRILSVREINEEISGALARAFPQTVWIRGEVQRLPHDAQARQHLYFELHETGQSGAAEYAVAVSLMGWDRQKFGLGRFLDGTDPDLQLANQLEVCLECRVDFYAKFGKLSLKVVGVDPHYSLGRLEIRRREVLEFLRGADLLEANGRVPLPQVPLRVGLITAPGSAAERDFMTGLEASPWAFVVVPRPARMQGEQLEAEVVAALRHLQNEDVDVVVITRGGGSRADLSWFDQKDLAMAIARCTVPVVTAIGHEIDRSIADAVAHHSCKTPTAAADFLVQRVQAAALRLDAAATGLASVAQRHLDDGKARLQVAPRLERAVRAAVMQSHRRTHQAAGRLQQVAGGSLAAAGLLLGERSTRLGREASRFLAMQGSGLDALGTQARLLDPARLLRRGYTITSLVDGAIVTSAADAAFGVHIRTRFKDGVVTSRVTNHPTPNTGGDLPGKGVRVGGKKSDSEEDTGQEPLFR